MLALLLAAQVAAAPPPAALDRLAWLAGCWSRTRPNGHAEEHWMAPAGGVMLGMARTVRDGKLRDYEFVRIEARASETLAYVAQPTGQAEATFTLKDLTDDAVVFENPAHDFPQRVLYRRTGPTTMAGRIEGVVDGKPRAVDFPYERCR